MRGEEGGGRDVVSLVWCECNVMWMEARMLVGVACM